MPRYASATALKKLYNIIVGLLNGKANSSHTHIKSQITDFAHNHTKSQITDFTHTHDDRYYTESESDAKYKIKGDFAVVDATVLENTRDLNVAYPSGFNKDNCVVISAMCRNINQTQGAWSSGAVFDTGSHVLGADPCSVTLMNDYMRVAIKVLALVNQQVPTYQNITSNYFVRIVLMKV